MTPDDFGRLGELIRRGGVWKGKRLLSREYVRRAVAPSKTNGCYGWLIWVNAAAPCIGPTVANRPVEDDRDFPDLPADMYNFSGLFGQRVTVFPTQDLVIVRTGQDPGLVPAGRRELGARPLRACSARSPTRGSSRPARRRASNKETRHGQGLRLPDRALRARPVLEGREQDPLPPAGPARARAAIFGSRREAARARLVRVEARLPDAVACRRPVRDAAGRRG